MKYMIKLDTIKTRDIIITVISKKMDIPDKQVLLTELYFCSEIPQA